MSTAHETSIAAAKASFPTGVVLMTLGGIALQDWVFILTLIYLVVQIGHLIWRWVRDVREEKEEDAEERRRFPQDE